MEECSYCGDRFDDEESYVRHLRDEHEGELGRIDRQRVEQLEPEGPSRTALYAVVVLLGVVIAGVAYTTLGGGGGGGGSAAAFDDPVKEPYNAGSIHEHGTMEVVVNGERIDFSQDQYQLEDKAFHFESGNGERWHVHAEGVTLEYALETLGIGVTNETLVFDGTTYDRSQGDTVIYEVNGKIVNPETYVLRDGDQVRVVANKSL